MINLVGAKPVLADITSVKDWNVSVSTIKEKITDLTKAVIIVHYAGYPIKDIVEISELCKKRNIYLIEDVAHAPGASLNGKMCGTFGDIGCFSFFTNKNLSIGEGGMVSTLNTNLHQKLGYLRSHGMTTLTLDRHKGRAISYDVVNPGLNYRMDEIHASIGLVQLSKLLAANERRSVLTNRYRANLAETPIIIPFSDQPEKANSAYHLLPVLLPDGLARTKVIEALKDNGIQSSIHYPPFWSFTAYSKMFDPNETPFTSDICSRELTLPLFPTMKESEVDQVTAILSDLLV
jgi:dTDP-4-amino-4,6-dideoxygalactose transaminase